MHAAIDSQKCISALALLSLSAIYDWGGPDHVQLTPIIGEMAMAVDLHKQPPVHLPLEEKDRRRLLFWGIYAMDRAGEVYLISSLTGSRWKHSPAHVLPEQGHSHCRCETSRRQH